MTDSLFINQPKKRRGILVLKQTDIDAATVNNDDDFMRNEELLVLPYPLTIPHGAISELVQVINEMSPGELILQSPYNSERYEKADVAQIQFAVEKYMLFSELCGLLGAKEVIITDDRAKLKNDTRNLKADLKLSDATAKAGIEESSFEKFVAIVSLHDKFSGGKSDVAAALDLLRRNNLLADKQMTGLINLRKESANQIVERTLKINMSNEITNRMKLFVGLNIPGNGIASDYKSKLDEKFSLNVSVTVKF